MVNKKIRKSAGLTGVVITLLLVMGFFSGMFLYWEWNAEDAGLSVDSKYNDTYQNLSEAQEGLSDNVDEIKENYEDVKEADNAFQVAWNGLKGLGNTMKLPISFLTSSLATYTAFETSLDSIIPDWVKNIIIIGITAGIVFLVLAILRGRS